MATSQIYHLKGSEGSDKRKKATIEYRRFSKYRCTGEWFRLEGELVDFLRQSKAKVTAIKGRPASESPIDTRVFDA